MDLEQKVATEECAKEEQLGRREWVLAEKNSGKAGAQEKDSDFFNKLRSFIKRRGRLLHKQAKVRCLSFSLVGFCRLRILSSGVC